MGMFDYLKCSYPLPGEPPAFVTGADDDFQTKDMPDPMLDHYEITVDGRLLKDGVDTNFHGDLEFYAFNASSGPLGFYTRNGEDAEWVEYRVRFTHGRVESIEEIERTRESARRL
jgi:hypothetical protein